VVVLGGLDFRRLREKFEGKLVAVRDRNWQRGRRKISRQGDRATWE